MKVNTYGIKMVGLKKASGETCNCNQGYYQISYDKEDGEVIAVYHVDRSDWTQYHSDSIVTVANTERHMTMQEIADAIAQNID